MATSPNKGKSLYHTIFCGGGDEITEEQREVLAYLVSSGSTDAQVATYYGVTRQSLHKWKQENPEFFKLFKDNKKIANENVVKALYDRAVGYEKVVTKAHFDKGEAIFVQLIEEIPPDVSAIKYWLNNRMPDEWKEQVHQVNDNRNTEVEQFDLSEFSDAELEQWENLLRKAKPIE